MEDKRENGGSPEQDKGPEREFRGLYKYVKISERSLNWIIIVLGAALVICFGIGYANRGYMVEFDARGGTVVESQKRMYGDLVTVPEEPVREGSVFEGWYTDENLTIPWDLSKDTVTGPMTLYAKWRDK